MNTLTAEEVAQLTAEQWEKLVKELAHPDRAESMWKACELLRLHCPFGEIVETGSIRGWAGDGQSTLIFAMLAIRERRHFFSYDINTKPAETWLGPLVGRACFSEGDSVSQLSYFGVGIALLYLDSKDYDVNKPLPCQIHQCAELGAAFGKMTDKAIILLDDASQEHGGKTALSSAFLLERGWKMIHNAHQQLFCNFDIAEPASEGVASQISTL